MFLSQFPLPAQWARSPRAVGGNCWETSTGPKALPSSLSQPNTKYPKGQERGIHTHPHLPLPFPPGQGWQIQAEAPHSSSLRPWQTSLINHSNLFAQSLAATFMVSTYISRWPISGSTLALRMKFLCQSHFGLILQPGPSSWPIQRSTEHSQL